MSYNYVTVTWKYETSADGTAAVGRVEWYPTGTIVDTTNDVDLNISPIVKILDDTGSFSVNLLATDNTGLSTFGWYFVPYVAGEDPTPVAYYANFADGASQEFGSLTKFTSS